MGANMIAVDRSEIQARKFYAQRNMYLCGFTLFLSLILNRTYVLVVDLLHAEDKLKALGASSNASVKADAIASESKDEVSKLKKELEQKNKDIEALKKQAANLSAEYNRVSDELNAKEGISARTKSD
jgi:peptidoglycan hydrolase CwlO-like protein